MVSGAFGLVIIVIGIFIQEILFMYKTNPYPYIRCKLEPSGRVMRLFIAQKGIHTERTSKTMWATTLDLQYAIKLREFGKVQKLKIHHEYPWQKVVLFKPGQAAYLDYVIKHPNTAHIILYEFSIGRFDIDYAKPVPAFYLKEASGHYFLPPMSISQLVGNPQVGAETLPTVVKMSRKIIMLKSAMSEAISSKLDWHRRCIRAEDMVREQENEIRSLIEGKSDRKQSIILEMLAIAEDQNTIIAALKQVKKTTISFNKWLALTFLGLGTLGFLYVMRGALGSLGALLNNTANMVFAFFVVVAICLLLYYLVVQKSGK